MISSIPPPSGRSKLENAVLIAQNAVAKVIERTKEEPLSMNLVDDLKTIETAVARIARYLGQEKESQSKIKKGVFS